MYALPADDLAEYVDYRDGETVQVKVLFDGVYELGEGYITVELLKHELEALLQGFKDNEPEEEPPW